MGFIFTGKEIGEEEIILTPDNKFININSLPKCPLKNDELDKKWFEFHKKEEIICDASWQTANSIENTT